RHVTAPWLPVGNFVETTRRSSPSEATAGSKPVTSSRSGSRNESGDVRPRAGATTGGPARTTEEAAMRAGTFVPAQRPGPRGRTHHGHDAAMRAGTFVPAQNRDGKLFPLAANTAAMRA